jgi:aminocarboxymuconate-semialdehyde decarboxylase
VCRILNDGIADVVKDHSEQFKGLAHVPLQDPKLALRELERSMGELGLSGVQLGSNVRGLYLGDDAFIEFFEAVEALQAVVLIHPVDIAGYDRLQHFYGRNLIGNPLDTTITAASIIFSGMFDRLPKLKIILCHAGGMMPYIIGRWDHGSHVRSECKKPQRLPSSYLSNFYYDTIAHSPESLRFLVERVGADKVVVGSDYPLDMGLVDPIGTLLAAQLPSESEQVIVRETARTLFQIK